MLPPKEFRHLLAQVDGVAESQVTIPDNFSWNRRGGGSIEEIVTVDSILNP